MKPFRLALCLLVSCCWSACGGGKGGGGGDPPLLPNDPPVLQVPSGLTGTSPRYTFTLPIAGSQTLTFAATDPDGDPLLWQIGVPGAAATTVGAVFTSPQTGASFTLQIQPVTAAAAAPLILLVEDPRGNAASIDLLVVRTGAPSISAVAPDSAFAGQPQMITVTGSALRLAGAANTVARFDGLAGTGAVLVDETTLTCATPAAAVAGPTVVSVANQFGTAALPASAFTIYAYPPSFQPTDQRLDAGTASALHMEHDGMTIHAVWLEASAVVYRRSVDGGATWDPSQMLSGVAAGSEPVVLVAGQDVSVTWIANGTAVWFARSVDGGVTFVAAVRLDTNGAPGTPRSRPRLCQSGDRRHATWIAGDATVGTARVLATASADRGAVWTAPVVVSDALANQGNQEIVADGAVALIVLEDARLGPALRGIYVVRSTDGGGSWGTARRLNTPSTAGGLPRLAAAARAVHCCWLQNDALFYTASPDNGASWSNTVSQMQSPQAGVVSAPALCAEADRVFLGYVVGGSSVWVSRFAPVGSTVQHTLVDSAIAVSAETRIGCAGNYVFVAWREGDFATGASRIQQAVSGDRGATFPAPAGLGNGTAAQTGPQLLHDGARLLLGWLDSRDPTAGVFVNRTAQ